MVVEKKEKEDKKPEKKDDKDDKKFYKELKDSDEIEKVFGRINSQIINKIFQHYYNILLFELVFL